MIRLLRPVLAAVLLASALASMGCVATIPGVPAAPLGPVTTPSPTAGLPIPTASTTLTTVAGSLPGAFPADAPRLSLGFPLFEKHVANMSSTPGDIVPLEFSWTKPFAKVEVDVLFDSQRCTVTGVRGMGDSTKPGWSKVTWRQEPDTSVAGSDTRLILTIDVTPEANPIFSGTICILDIKTDDKMDKISFTPVKPKEAARAMNFVELVPGGLQPLPGSGPNSRLQGSITRLAGPGAGERI